MPLSDLSRTQPQVAEELESALSGGFLPQSLLFMGQRGSSRLTGALDLAFELTGNEKGREVLSSPDIVYFPHRDFTSRLKAATAMFRTMKNNASRLFLIESVRLVLFQYHSSQVSVAPSTVKNNFQTASDIDQMLLDYEEDRDYSDKEISLLCDTVDKKVLDPKFMYYGKRNPSPVSIDSIRGIEEWFSSGNDEKVVIIEDIEDATDGARNSLLKTLEEPPEHCHLILVSSNPQKIMETILSRVRKFSFPELSRKTTASLIAERFRTSGDFTSFDSFFFLKGSGENARNELVKDVQLFVNSVLGGKMMSMEEEDAFLTSLDKLSATRYFRERVGEEIEKAAKEGRTPCWRARKVMNIINSWILSSDVYNLSDKSSFDLMLREAHLVQ